MEMTAALGLDIAVVAIVLCCVYRAAKKGFLRTVIQMAAYILILFVSVTVSQQAAPIIYKRAVEPALFERYLGITASERKDNAALVMSLAGQPAGLLRIGNLVLPSEEIEADETPEEEPDGGRDATVRAVIDGVLRQLEENGKGLSALLQQSLSEIDLSRLELDQFDLSALEELYEEGEMPALDELISPELQREILQEIAGQTIQPAVEGILKVICFALTFAVLSLVMNLLLMMLGVVKYLPVIGGVNAFMGGVVGFLQGLLLVWVAALLVYGVLQLFGGSWWIFSDSVVEKSFLFQYFIFPGVLGR